MAPERKTTDKKDDDKAIEDLLARLARARPQEKGAIYMQLGDAYRAMNQGNKAIVYYHEAYGTGLRSTDFVERFTETLVHSGSLDKAMAVIVETIGATEDPVDKARLYLRHVRLSWLLNDLESAKRMSELALKSASTTRYESKESKRVRAEANECSGRILWKEGDPNLAIKRFEKALSLYEALGNKEGMAKVLNGIGIIHSYKGELDKAKEFYRRSISVQDVSRGYTNLGILNTITGDYKEADECLRTAMDKARKEGYQTVIVLVQVLSCDLSLAMGNVKKARALIDIATNSSSSFEDKTAQTIVLEALARVQLAEGKPAEARATAQRLRETAKAISDDIMGARADLIQGRAEAAEGELEKARTTIADAVDFFEDLYLRIHQMEALVEMALVEKRLGNAIEAAKAAKEARFLARKIGARPVIERLDTEGL